MNPALCRTAFRSSGAATVGRRAIRPRSVSATTNATNTTSLLRPLSSSMLQGSNRFFSDAAPAKTEGDAEAAELSSPKLQGLYDRVVTLPEEEVNILGAMVLQILGRTIFPGQFGTPGGAGGAMVEGAGAEAAEEVVEEKTAFDVKLLGFDAKSKIKVIKEVRAVAGLGLKEAKELVESAPKVISKDMKKEAADELKEKFEALGAEIEIV